MKITFPDGNEKEFDKGSTGHDIAMSISEGLARNSVAIKIADKTLDLTTPIDKDSKIQIITLRDKEGVEIYRHSSGHIMALAVKRLFPSVKLAIGPTIENGFYYDFDEVVLKNEDFTKIESEMKKIIKEKIPFERFVVPRDEALKIFKDEPYKVELINDLPEGEVISYYKIDSFLDLCRGPHLPHSGMVKAFKLLKIAGAYWRGNSDNKMLTRIYATSFPDKKEMNLYLEERKKAEENDHVRLGKEIDLFMTHKDIGQGLPLLTPRGSTIKKRLQNFVEREEFIRGYQETITPFMAKSDLYKISGHWQHYKDGMFVIGDEDKDKESEVLALRPMTCPFQFLLYNRKKHSYRELPVRYSETSALFRKESSGEMHGLTRVRQFTLSEGHIICTADQVKEEFKKVLELINYIMKTLDLTNYYFRFSKWDPANKEKYIDNPKAWDASQKALKEILDEIEMEYVEVDDEAAFYGPKLDIQMKNVWGKEDTIITVQIDFALPERFDMNYIDQNGEKVRPMVIHRSSIGCYERTIALLIEKFGGKFPFWLAPDQIKILTINDSVYDYANKLRERFMRANLTASVDQRSETLKRKVRDAQLEYVPAIITVGGREEENNEVSVRTLDGKVTTLSVDNFISRCRELTESFSLTTSF